MSFLHIHLVHICHPSTYIWSGYFISSTSIWSGYVIPPHISGSDMSFLHIHISGPDMSFLHIHLVRTYKYQNYYTPWPEAPDFEALGFSLPLTVLTENNVNYNISWVTSLVMSAIMMSIKLRLFFRNITSIIYHVFRIVQDKLRNSTWKQIININDRLWIREKYVQMKKLSVKVK